MDCARCREIVSADLDREASAEDGRVAAGHLDVCAPCRSWVGRAAAVTWWARTHAVDTGPDLVAGVLDALGHGRPGRAADPTCFPTGQRLVLLAGGEAPSDCGCAASCGCGCRQERPCRCGGHRAA